MEVGVRELKEHLSEYLERAARGEIIRVTDRGQPKAVLGPLPGELRLRQGIEEGWIIEGTDERPRKVVRQRAEASILAALAEDRGT